MRGQKLTLGDYYVPVTTPGSKWIRDLSVRAKTIKLSAEDTGVNFHDWAVDWPIVLRYDTKK